VNASPEQPHQSTQDIIQRQAFHQVSQELWDTPVYGDVARQWIDYTEQAKAHGMVYVNEQGFSVKIDAGVHHVASRKEIGPMLRQILPHCPYALLLAPTSPEDRQVYQQMDRRPPDYQIYPGELLTSRLAECVRARKLDKHAFHGSLGKALDVMGGGMRCR